MKKTLLLLFILTAAYTIQAQIIPSYIPTDSLQAWYPFNGNAINEAGTGKNGIPVGALPTTDRFGTANSAYNFDGITDHISIDTAFFKISWSNYTISYWANSDTVDNPYNGDNIQIMINTIPHNGFAIGHNFNTTYKYSLFFNSNPVVHTWDILGSLPSKSPITSHSWKHFVMEKRNDTAYRFYINGILDTEYISYKPPVSYFCKIIIGNNDTTIGNYGFWGKLDDYAIWNRALANCEVRRLYSSAAYTYITGQPANATVSVGGTARFSVTDTGTGNTYQWQGNTGSGFVNLAAAPPYSGVNTPTLTVTPVTAPMNNNKYRCIVSGAYTCTDTSAYGKIMLPSSSINVNSARNIFLAPNPTTGDISVFGAGKVHIKVFNTVGQLVKEAADSDKISISELPAGAYSIKVYDLSGAAVYYDKIIKR